MRVIYSQVWLVLLALACTNASPTRRGKSTEYDYAPFTSHAISTGNEYEDFEDTSAKKYNLEATVDEASVETLERDELLSGTGSAPVLKVPEPDAEMLPAHYTGVQPPGVDHMELRVSQLTSMMVSDRKSGPVDGTKMAVHGGSVTSSGRVQVGKQSLDEFEKYPATKGSVKNLQKGHHAKDARKKMTRADIIESFDEACDEVTSGSKSVDRDRTSDRPKDENGVVYRSSYRKDEYKKDADFYGKDPENGRFREHGQYAGRENNFRNFESS